MKSWFGDGDETEEAVGVAFCFKTGRPVGTVVLFFLQ